MRGIKSILFGSVIIGLNIIPYSFFQQLTARQMLGGVVGGIIVSIGWLKEE